MLQPAYSKPYLLNCRALSNQVLLNIGELFKYSLQHMRPKRTANCATQVQEAGKHRGKKFRKSWYERQTDCRWLYLLAIAMSPSPFSTA